MKKIVSTSTAVIIVIALILPLFISGCYTNTVDTFGTFTVQIPLDFTSKWRNKSAPDTSLDFTDLNNYKEYRDNKDDIQRTIFYQFAYWIDSIRVPLTDPGVDKLEFDFVRYYLYFEGEPASSKHLLGEFKKVKVKDYFRIPHVIAIPDDVGKILETAAKTRTRFYTVAEYSAPTSVGSGYFPYIDSRFDLVVRLELKL